MKIAVLFATLLPSLAASAQKLVAAHPAVIYHVGQEKAPLFRAVADTAGKTGYYISPGQEVSVVGEYSPRWVIVKREGFLYLTSARNLTKYSGAEAVGFPIDPQTKQITYEGVVQVPGVSKADLYTRAYSWIAQTYRSANDVIQMQDKEAGQLVAKGNMNVSVKNSPGGVVRHILTIYVKDGRYKYILTGLTHDAAGAPNILSAGPLEQEKGEVYLFGGKKAWDMVKQEANQDCRSLIAELEAAMTLKGGKNPSDF